MQSNRDKAFRGWAKFLNPAVLRGSLLQASLYLTVYEFLSQALIEHLEAFFLDHIDNQGKFVPGQKYREEVLALHEKQMPFFASALWFRDHGALSDRDVERLSEIREHRNFVAHNLPEVLGDIEKNVNLELLREMADIVHKIDSWWLREIEIPTNPDFDGVDPDDLDLDAAFSMRSMMLELIIEAASGDDSRLQELYEMFKRDSGYS